MKFIRTITITKIERKILRTGTVSRTADAPRKADGEPPHLESHIEDPPTTPDLSGTKGRSGRGEDELRVKE
jgi:hypothetical protein